MGRTLLVSAAVAVSCAVLVSAAVGYLRPLQIAQTDLEKHQHILQAAGLIDAGSTATRAETAELYSQLERRLVNLSSGAWVTGNADTYDFAQAAVDPERSVALSSSKDIAKLGRQALVMPVYLLVGQGRVGQEQVGQEQVEQRQVEQRQTRRVVLPVYGKGMWSEIYAFVALEDDFSTIASLVIHTHGETPGIGDRIEAKEWLDQWRGKKVAPNNADTLLKLAAATSSSASIHTIDAITGATVTTQSLVTLVNFWLGDSGYRTFIDRLQQVEQDKVP